jgi:2-polyprenyl-3-methyl-5-hydroxy-6-metoxy-1,4-benzoquinol methylase
LAYLNPRPKKHIIDQFYNQDYFTGVSRSEGFGGLECNGNESGNMPHKIMNPRPLKMLCDKFSGVKSKTILEIGCATGDLLSVLKDAGAIVTGLEFSEYAAEKARAKGLSVAIGDFEHYEVGNLFDIVMAFEVIKHVVSPMKFLSKASNLIKPDGLLILGTPNYSGAHRHHSDWSGFNFSFEHLYFFSVDVLKRLASKAGLQLLYWETSIDPTGPPYSRKLIYRQINKIGIVSTLMLEQGLLKALDLVFRRPSPLFLPFGNGRALTLVFKKIRPIG